MTAWIARAWIALIEATAHWSPRARTRLARVLGALLWWVVVPRRRVALANLRACFPAMRERERRRIGRALADNIARAALDHGLLMRGSREEVERYVTIDGLEHLRAAADRPLIVIAPHFVGLDAGGVRLNAAMRGMAMYSKQKNPVWDAWLYAVRKRFSDPVLIARQNADLRALLRGLKSGLPLYFLPDMDLGRENSIFVPFFGVDAATVPAVSRLARIAGARVVMAVTEMTRGGYVLHVEPPWPDFPGESPEEDTERMNREIERWVLRMPDQYLWTHKRFKTRPAGAPGLY
jgi:KDO2-lipid IV(A) lauroyltransferase